MMHWKKRIVCLFLSGLLIIGFASVKAAEIDYDVLTDEQLQEIIDKAGEVLSDRQTKTDNLVIFESVDIKQSPDKYTWYVKNYVGKNVASFGYTSLGGDRLERYGSGYVEFSFVTADGSYLDIDNEAQLREYVVTGQSIKPNTELNLVFQKDSKGKEYSNLIESQSIKQIVLSVKKVGTDAPVPKLTAINASPDKYTWYIRDYVGQNLAFCGYSSLGGDRLDAYGNGYVKLVFVTDDGRYVDIEDNDIFKNYVVTGQNIKPNTEMKLVYLKDSKGKEYSNLIDTQNISQIVLSIKKVGVDTPIPKLISIKPSPDKYTWYIREYVGQNLASCGYSSWGGDRLDEYGHGRVKLIIITGDGSHIGVEDEEKLKSYVVVGQNIKPNTELKLIYMTDSNGKEYSNLIEWQNIYEIELLVNRIKNNIGNTIVLSPDSSEETVDNSRVRVDLPSDDMKTFKELMDEYEMFIIEYVDFRNRYSTSDNKSSMLSKYIKYTARYTKVIEKIQETNEEELSAIDAAYYLEVTARIYGKLGQVIDK